jgi:glycosyltransferase involved in cell wall biosynthesis
MDGASVQPKVSVFMVTYNHAEYIADAIESVLRQKTTFPFELIVSDDGSQDGTAEIVREYARKNPSVIRNLSSTQNVGNKRNYMRAYDACAGQYIAWLDGDDIWAHEWKLQQQAEILDADSTCTIVFGRANAFERDPSQCCFTIPDSAQATGNFSLESLLHTNFIPSCTVMYRSGPLPRFPEWLLETKHTDYPMHIAHAMQGGIRFLDEVLAHYRVHQGGISSSKNQKQRCINVASDHQILADNLGLGSHPTVNAVIKEHYFMAAQLAAQEGSFVEALRYCVESLKKWEFDCSVPNETIEQAALQIRRHVQTAKNAEEVPMRETAATSVRARRVLIACDYFWPSIGGVETIAENLGVYFQNHGYEVEVAARALPVRFAHEHRGLRVHSIPVSPGELPWQCGAAVTLRRLIIDGEYTAVVMLADPLTWVLWAAQDLPQGLGTRVIVQPLINDEGYSQWKDHQEMRRRLRDLLGNVDAIVTLTRSGRDAAYLSEEGLSAAFVPNATTPVSAPGDIRAELGITDEVPIVIQIGNLWPVKNQLGLLETVRSMAGSWHLVLVGHPTADSDYVSKIRASVTLDPRVTWVPGWPAAKVGALMDAAKLVLLPSLAEVSPVVLLEAMSHGRAWLATPCCGAVSELAGGLAAPLDTFPVLIDLLLTDEGLREALGQAGKAHWQSNFCWERVGSAWQELVENGALTTAFDMPDKVAETMGTLIELVRGRLERAMGAAALGQRGGGLPLSVRAPRPVLDGTTPLVSVIVPTYNRPDLLVRALGSIKGQTYRNIEVVVVNDAGAAVENLVTWFGQDANIVYVRHGRNRGLAAARNTGLSVARGEIITYLDDDDIFLADHVATVVEALQTGSNPFVYTEAEYVVESAELGQMKEMSRGRSKGTMSYSRERLHICNYIPVNSWAHWRTTLTGTGIFDEGLDNHEDWDFLLRCARQFDLTHIPKVTVQVHQRSRADNMLRRERHKFYDTFRLLYSRYDDLGNPEIARGREQMLSQLLKQGESQPASVGQPTDMSEPDRAQQEYRAWRSKRTLQEIDAQLFGERMTLRWRERPTFHMIMLLEQGEEALLADSLDSIAAQFYADWRLSVVAPFQAPDAAFHEVQNLQWIEVPAGSSAALMVDAVVASAGREWLMVLPVGAQVEAHTFLRFGDYINLHPEWRLIYADDDQVEGGGEFSKPRFKPDFNLDWLRSMDYIGPYIVRADAWTQCGGYSRLEGAESYDMCLRVLDQLTEKAIGHVADVLIHLPTSGDDLGNEANRRLAVAEHLARRKIAATVTEGYAAGTHRVVYARPYDPLVSIIIPNRDKLEFLEPCVESLLEKTAYGQYEVLIVDNQSTDPDVLEYYEDLKARYPQRVRVLAYDAPFNFSAMNNLAARKARGDYLLLLNNDTQVVQGEWLERMLSYGQRPDVGIVGARLVYPETGKLQHAGVVLGLQRVADHIFNGLLDIRDPGYMNRAQVDQDFSAVTAACLLIRKSTYWEVHGFDEEAFRVSYNDVDLCLKVREQGYRIVWTPYATLVHHGSVSQKGENIDLMKQALNVERFQGEQAAMLSKWLPKLADDPAYNRNLSLAYADCRVEGTVVIDWDTNFHDRPRILSSPLSGGSGEYRVIGPFRALSRAGLAQCDVVQMGKMFQTRVLTPVEIERTKPDTLVLQTAIDNTQIEAMGLYKQFNPDVLRVFTLDDLLTQIPRQNSFYRYSYRDSKPRLRKALALCDRAIVTTEPLAELCRPMIDDVRVIPNRLERALWGDLASLRRQGPKPRVGWAGAQQHAGDLALMTEVVKATAREVDWVFFGMCPEELRPYVREFHDFVLSFYDYPAKLASLNLDLAVAPLEVNPFNEAKSNLRLLEYGIMGWPVVCTDIYPYQDAPVKRVANDPQAWVDAIRERVHDLDAAEREGDRLKSWVLEHFILEDHLDDWLKALVR